MIHRRPHGIGGRHVIAWISIAHLFCLGNSSGSFPEVDFAGQRELRMSPEQWVGEGLCQQCTKETRVITIDGDSALSLCPVCLADSLDAVGAAARSALFEEWDRIESVG